MAEQYDFDEWHRSYLEREHKRKEEIRLRLREIALPELQKNAVDRVVFDYSGYGDSGGIDDIKCYSKGTLMAQDLLSVDSKKALEEYAESIVPDGFEVNEGGQGNLFLDIPRTTWKLVHGRNYQETETDTTQGEF